MHVTSTSGNDTHCRLLSLWIIPACRTGTVLYYMHIFICTLRLLSSPTVDVTCICSVYYDFYSISLFAEMVLHVGQIPMLVYIYKVEILSVCPSVTLLTRLWLSTLSHQLPDTVNPSSSSFKFVSRVNAVIRLRSEDKESGENSSNIPSKITASGSMVKSTD